MENINNNINNGISEKELIRQNRKRNKKAKKDSNTYYVVEVNIKDKFSIVNRNRVVYHNKNQYLTKIRRNEVRLFEKFNSTHFWSSSTKFTYNCFCKNLINFKQTFLVDKKSPYFYILIQKKDYKDFKEKLYSLNENTDIEKFEIDFIRSARRLKNLKRSINNELLYISSRQNHLKDLEDEKASWIEKYKQTKTTVLNFYKKNNIPQSKLILDLIDEIKEIGLDKPIE